MSVAIPPLPQYAFMAWCLVKKHRNNFTFTFPFTNHIDYMLIPRVSQQSKAKCEQYIT